MLLEPKPASNRGWKEPLRPPKCEEGTEARTCAHSPELSSISRTIQIASSASSFSLPLPFSLFAPDSPSDSSSPAALPLRTKLPPVLTTNGVPTNALALEVSPMLSAPETSLEPFRHHAPCPAELDPDPETGIVPAEIVLDMLNDGVLGSRRSCECECKCGLDSKVTDESLKDGRVWRARVRNLTQTTFEPVGVAEDLRRRREVWRGRLKCALSRMESMEDSGAENATWVSWKGKSALSANVGGRIQSVE